MILCAFVTVFLIASCCANSSSEYRPACQVLAKQIYKNYKQVIKNLFDTISAEEIRIEECNKSFTVQVKSTSFSNLDDGSLYVPEKSCHGERFDADFHQLDFLMILVPHVIKGNIMVREGKNGKWIETTFTSELFNRIVYNGTLWIDNNGNVEDRMVTGGYSWRAYETVISDDAREETKDLSNCRYLKGSIQRRLQDIFWKKGFHASRTLFENIKTINMPEVEDEEEMQVIELPMFNETAKACACGDRDVIRGGNYGWVMDVQSVDKSGVSGQCLSSLISDRHILTARDCVAAKKLTVKLNDSKNLAVKKIVGIRGTGQNLAVIELSEPLKFSSSIVPVCLQTTNFSGRINLGKGHPDLVQPKYAHDREMTSLAGFNVTPKTHFFVQNFNKDMCPKLPYTQLYSGMEGTEYVVGVLHTENSRNFCQTGQTDIALFDRLFAYKNFFEKLLKDAKTCPPKNMHTP